MKLKSFIKERAVAGILNPTVALLDQNVADITTSIGAFIVRAVRGKFQRSITFTIGLNYYDNWMEEALYGILYKYNDIKSNSKLLLTNKTSDGTGMYYQLGDGTHNLKYRDYDILLNVQRVKPSGQLGRVNQYEIIYTIITFDLSTQFVRDFENDMVANRNSLLKIRKDSPTINVYQDYHEQDGWTYWEKMQVIYKRDIGTVYLPFEQKKTIIETINNFFKTKEYDRLHGIPHNLKILFYGEPGCGKDSIARMIASMWNRNIYYVTGGKDGRFIPNAIVDNDSDVNYPLYLISDIDKYPFLINEPDISMDNKEDAKDDKMKYKQCFGAMINALDGILSGEGKIIVMTTNHIEKFSEAFLRPGRIDLKMEIGYVTPEVFRRYVRDFYNVELPPDIELKNQKLRIPDMQFDIRFMHMSSDEFLKKHLK